MTENSFSRKYVFKLLSISFSELTSNNYKLVWQLQAITWISSYSAYFSELLAEKQMLNDAENRFTYISKLSDSSRAEVFVFLSFCHVGNVLPATVLPASSLFNSLGVRVISLRLLLVTKIFIG